MTTFHGRNIYYKDPALFRTQSTVDIYVDKLAYTFGVSRLALNVTAAAKGLVTGHFILTRTDGTQAYRKPDVPHLIEDPHDIQTIDTSDVAWVLVVEKESTFRTLASSNIHRNSIAGHGMIVTAKGYPDVSTRSFLHRLSVSDDPDCLPLPIYALCDFDPDGLAIMSTYKHGSFKLSHENAGLNAPSIQWLGIRAESVLAGNGQDDYHGLLTLSARDRKKAVDMLERMEPLQESGTEEEWRRELQVMLLLNVKAEMEILAEREGGVRRWVDEKLLTNLANLYTDENSLMTNRLGDMTLGREGSYSPQANEESFLDTLDTHEMAAMSCSEEDSRSLQLDDRCLDTHQPEDISPGETGFPRPEWDEEL
ncbi:Spo11/DNA topoisomerase VI subunit A [Usnea florida]